MDYYNNNEFTLEDYKKLYEKNEKEIIRLRKLLRKANICPWSSEEKLLYVDYETIGE